MVPQVLRMPLMDKEGLFVVVEVEAGHVLLAVLQHIVVGRPTVALGLVLSLRQGGTFSVSYTKAATVQHDALTNYYFGHAFRL